MASTKRKTKPKPTFIGYSNEEINTLNKVIPGGTGVQGHKGVQDTPGGGDLSQIKPPLAATPQPPDPNYLNAQLIANRNLAVSRGQAAYDTGSLNFDYGYNTDGTVNTANPYSRAALYQLGYEHQQAGTTNSLAARGQLYSGALQNQRNADASSYSQAEAANRLAYQRSLHGIQAGQLGAAANAGTGVSDADFTALLNATYPRS